LVNNLYTTKRFYWIIRDTGKSTDPHISKGFMRQVNPPWLVGSGIQFRLGKYVLQIGICGGSKSLSDDEGLLYAMEGRVMDSNPKEIGNWR
jgi:hypothetical protein